MATGINSKFDVNLDSLIIRTKNKVNFMEVKDFIQEHFGTFPKRSRFTVLCGVHHKKDANSDVSKLCFVPDSPEVELVGDYHSMFEVLQRDCADIISERDYLMGDVVPIFTTEKELDIDDFDDDEEEENEENTLELSSVSINKLKVKFLDMLKLERPHVFIFASCWSYYSELNQVLQSIGIFSVLHVSKERGDITMENLFELNEDQKKFLKCIAEDDRKDIIVAGI